MFRNCPRMFDTETAQILSTVVVNHFESIKIVQGTKPCYSGHRMSLITQSTTASLIGKQIRYHFTKEINIFAQRSWSRPNSLLIMESKYMLTFQSHSLLLEPMMPFWQSVYYIQCVGGWDKTASRRYVRLSLVRLLWANLDLYQLYCWRKSELIYAGKLVGCPIAYGSPQTFTSHFAGECLRNENGWGGLGKNMAVWTEYDMNMAHEYGSLNGTGLPCKGSMPVCGPFP